MAQNDWAGEYVNIRFVVSCLDSDSSKSSDIGSSNSDSDSECDSVSPCFHL